MEKILEMADAEKVLCLLFLGNSVGTRVPVAAALVVVVVGPHDGFLDNYVTENDVLLFLDHNSFLS